MKTISRTWATPLAAGAFLLMAATGILMFFHVETGLAKEFHEWLGWLFVIGVGLHVATNWSAAKAHLAQNRARAIVGAFVVLLIVAMSPIGGESEGGPPGMRAAIGALERAPLRDVAPIAGRSVDTIVSDLQHAGFASASEDATLTSLAGDDRGAQFRALGVVFGAAGGEPEHDD